VKRSPKRKGLNGHTRTAPRRAPARSPARERLDALLVSRRLAESREKAARLILAGSVTVDGARVDKAGTLVSPTAAVEVAAGARFVSRGGDKLAPVLDAFGVSPAGRVCLDVGASTVDVSFISLEKVLMPVSAVLAPAGEVVALVKPQFEVGRGMVGKGGVVRDPEHHRAVLARVARFAVLHGWHVRGVASSPLRGPKGNREFFLHLTKTGRTVSDLDDQITRALADEPA
jgi:23S rRNA (cytidine1920-2'-O)/16S rRNA (cytidine1409-2'-O)-methyltransferase